jgi:hypothetical protein
LLADPIGAVGRDVKYIGLHDGIVREVHIHWGKQHLAPSLDASDVIVQDSAQLADEALMLNSWRRRHDEVTVDELVRSALGELMIVRVGVPLLFRQVDLGPVGGRCGHDAAASTLRRVHRVERSECPLRFRETDGVEAPETALRRPEGARLSKEVGQIDFESVEHG